MNRNFIACSLGALLLAVCFLAEAQQPKKVTRIGYLGAGDRARESTRAEAIRLALRELGYIEGQNIASEYRYAEGKQDRSKRPRMRPRRFPSLWPAAYTRGERGS